MKGGNILGQLWEIKGRGQDRSQGVRRKCAGGADVSVSCFISFSNRLLLLFVVCRCSTRTRTSLQQLF